MNTVLSIVQKINFYLSDYILIILLAGTGVFFTFKTRFVQVRCFGEGLKQVFGGMFSKEKSGGGMSSFQAFATAVAAQVGTGNIIGACGAVLLGGPGAVFWMWIIAFFGMATIYAEAVLAQETREVQSDGTVLGGPMFYIKKAFPGTLGRALSAFFSAATILALGFMGTMVQSNSISSACSTAFGIPQWLVGLIIASAAGLVFLGGVDRLACVTEKIVPLMALLYVAGSVTVLCVRAEYLGDALAMIFKYAVRPDAIIGGSVGYAFKMAISQGVKRGLFSNEAGMGSTPHAHALAEVDSPHKQGISAMIGVFIDTFVVLTMTALVVISVLYAGDSLPFGGFAAGIDKNNMASSAFSAVFGDKQGSSFIALCLLFFAFSSIISWNYFGKINLVSLFGKKSVPLYMIIAVVFIFLGSCLSNNLVWELTDMFNQLMIIPNVPALIALSGVVATAAGNKK